jgi:predicted aldo/keto reductase-like oxidoreductase
MTSKDRRRFIKQGLLGVTGAGLAAHSLRTISPGSGNLPGRDTRKDADKVLSRMLGKTGIELPVVSMGTGDTDNPNLVRAGMDGGIMLYATSRYYGNGRNEEMMGKVLKERDRDTCLIATSVMPSGIDHQQGLFTAESDPVKFKSEMEESLKFLGLDHVDIFFLPFAAKRESVFYEPLMRVMEDVKKEGKTRFIGIATHSFEPDAIEAASDTGIYDLVMTAYNFKHQQREAIEQALEYAVDKGLGTIAMKTMAGVYWDKERTKPINAQAALKWVIRNENIHTTVPGFTTFDQLESNLSIMTDPVLTEDEEKSLVSPEASPQSRLYCRQCRACSGRCPESVDIPTLMRSYMYAYAYRNLAHARQTLVQGCNGRLACQDCETCRVNCDYGIDIRERLLDIQRLEDIPEDFLA